MKAKPKMMVCPHAVEGECEINPECSHRRAHKLVRGCRFECEKAGSRVTCVPVRKKGERRERHADLAGLTDGEESSYGDLDEHNTPQED